MYQLIGPHVNAVQGGLVETLVRWRPAVIVTLDHGPVWRDVKGACPETRIVGRAYRDGDNPDLGPGLDVAATARDWADNACRQVEGLQDVYRALQVLNEPVIRVGEVDRMQRLAALECELMRVLAARGWRYAAGTFSVGNPPRLKLWAHYLDALRQVLATGGVLCLHEYGWPNMAAPDAAWYSLRHRKVYGGGVEEGGAWPGLPEDLKRVPLVIGECGLDGLLAGPTPMGWRSAGGLGMEGYLAQLHWYDRMLADDPYVLGAAVYCCGVNDPRWMPYDLWPEAAAALAVRAEPVYRKELATMITAPFIPPFLGHYAVTSSFAAHKARRPPSATPGTDWALPMGTPVLAVADGYVIARGNAPASSGRYVTTVHCIGGAWYETTVRHLADYTVRPHQAVRAGQVIGHSGNSGHSTGPHLHLDVLTGGVFVDFMGLV